jgi:hypothetical protein
MWVARSFEPLYHAIWLRLSRLSYQLPLSPSLFVEKLLLWCIHVLHCIDMQKQIADSPVLIATARKKCGQGSLREADSLGNCVCSLEWSAEIAGRSARFVCIPKRNEEETRNLCTKAMTPMSRTCDVQTSQDVCIHIKCVALVTTERFQRIEYANTRAHASVGWKCFSCAVLCDTTLVNALKCGNLSSYDTFVIILVRALPETQAALLTNCMWSAHDTTACADYARLISEHPAYSLQRIKLKPCTDLCMAAI